MKQSFFNIPVFLLLVSIVFIGCSKKEDFTQDDDQVVEEIEVGLTFRKASLKNQQIEFKIFDDAGNEILENVTFFVNDEMLTGNTFQSSNEGTFEVYGEYLVNDQTFVTDTETFSVITPLQKIVVEDYTGTWCGYCPAVSASVDEIASQTNQLSIVAIHNGDNLTLSIEPEIREGLGVFSGSPRAMVNRINPWGSANNFPVEDVLNQIGANASTAISINSIINDSNTLSVKINVASEEAIQNRKLVVYLTEDGIPDDQENYFNNDSSSPYFGLGNPIVDFEQNHVLRASLTDILGNVIPDVSALTDYEVSFNYDIPSNFVNDNLHIVVMVVDLNNEAINSQNAKVNTFVSYE